MFTYANYIVIAAGTLLMIVLSFLFIPLWTDALILSVCFVLFSAVLLVTVNRKYKEKERVFRRSEQRIRLMAYYDDLTGLPNRRFFREQLEQALERDSNKVIAVINVDIDRFRLFNDTLGHDFGDIILLQAAERLTRCAGAGDTVARMEGDEFVLLYPNLKNVEEIDKIALSIHEVFATPFSFQDYQLHTTISIGVAYHADMENVEADALIKHAGLALSRAKEQGDVQYEVYSPAMDIRSFEKLTLENELRRAIEQQEFLLYFQPQVEILTGKIVGVEALVRWQHPVKGIIPPGKFIFAAEENGLITALGDWVLRESCKQIKELHDKGFRDLRVGVNLSSRQFLQEDLAERIAKVLEETNLAPQYLELEITEGMTMDVERSLSTLNKLTDLGVRISMDDFGTGYSSLNYLKNFPIHRLKIDRSFVRDLLEDPNNAAIVSTIISMAHHLNLKVIAEGVETEEQLQYLNQNRCNEIQGYVFSPPISREDLEQLLKHQEAAAADQA